MYVIKFRKSSSKYFTEAVLLAQKFDNFAFEDGEYTISMECEESLQKKDYLRQLYYLIYKWKHSRFFFNNREISHAKIVEILIIRDCYAECKKSRHGKEHCLYSGNLENWSCKKVNTIGRYIFSDNKSRYGDYWFTYGKLIDGHIWKVDKAKIRRKLIQDVEQTFALFCPMFDVRRMHQILDDLPDEIDLKEIRVFEVEDEKVFDGEKWISNAIRLVPKVFEGEEYNDMAGRKPRKILGTRELKTLREFIPEFVDNMLISKN
jgi:hypothetical protein